MSQKDLSAFGNRFSAGRATAGTTYTTVNENVQVLGSLSVGSNITSGGTFTVTGPSSFSDMNTNSLNVNSGKTLIDSNGNIVSLGNLSLAGVATMNNIYASGATSIQSLNVNSGKLTIDSQGNLASLGTFSSSGNATFSNLNATGAVSVGGNATMLGPLYANSGIDVNSGKFTVDTSGHLVSQGNVSALGTLSVGGIATFGSSVYSGAAYLSSVNVNSGKFTIDSQGNVAAVGTLSVGGNATFSNINVAGVATVAGNLNMTGNISANGSISGSSLESSGGLMVSGTTTLANPIVGSSTASFTDLFLSGTATVSSTLNAGQTNVLGLSLQNSKFTLDSNGNVVSTGNLGLTGNATMSGTLAVSGASTFGNSVNVQSGKFVIDSTGNIGIGSTPSGAVMDIYNNNSRIRLRGTGTGIEWNNSGSSVLSSMIYDTDGKIKMYSSATANPKMSIDNNNILLINNPSQTIPGLQTFTGITPIGILTITGKSVVNVSQTDTILNFTGQTATALIIAARTAPKSYVYIDHDNYRSMLLYCTSSTQDGPTINLVFVDVIGGSTVSMNSSLTDVNVYLVSSVVTNGGKVLSTSLVSPDGNPRVVVSNQYGQLGLSA